MEWGIILIKFEASIDHEIQSEPIRISQSSTLADHISLE